MTEEPWRMTMSGALKLRDYLPIQQQQVMDE